MEYNIYIHHSSKNQISKAGYLIKDGCGITVKTGVVETENQGYGVGLFLAAIEAVKQLPDDAVLNFYSPCASFTTKKKTKTAKAEKKVFYELVEGRAVISHIIEAASGIQELKDSVFRLRHHFTRVNDETVSFLPDYIAYTDGSCNNLSPYREGGAAYVILDSNGNMVKRNSKGFVGVTNNKMELMAILSAVASVPEGTSMIVYTDSQYCIQVLSNKANANNFTRPNADVIRQYFKYAGRLKNVRFEWVKGHNGNEYNELVDAMANSRTEEMRVIHKIPIFNKHNSPKARK